MSFADNLATLRKLNDLSQEELADRIGVSRQTLSKYETGESLPDIEKCKALADFFSVSLDDLISYEKDDGDSMGLSVPPKGKHIFGINPGDNLIVLGDEGQGIAIIKEKGLLGLINMAKRI